MVECDFRVETENKNLIKQTNLSVRTKCKLRI